MSELRIERRYPIAPAKLFAYVTETQNLMQWWGPDGATVTDADIDLTRTGPWSVVFDSPRGTFAMRGEVREVTPPVAVEFTMSVPGEEAHDSTVRFEIAADDEGGSRFTLIQRGISEAMVEMGKRGWGATLSRLEKAFGLAARAA